MKTIWHLTGALVLTLSSLGAGADPFMDAIRRGVQESTGTPAEGRAQGEEEDTAFPAGNAGPGNGFSPFSFPLSAYRIPENKGQKELLAENGRVDPALQRLAQEVGTKGIGDLETLAKGLSVPLEGSRVAVRLAGSDPEALRRQVEGLGGEVTTGLEGSLFATLPAESLAGLNHLEGLDYAAPQAVFEPNYRLEEGALVSEGVKASAADRLHVAGIRGKGVKVGILDFGFQRYSELQNRGEVPAPVAAKAFNDSGNLESDTVHGTACAEIIHDMAPEASLYLAAVSGREDQIIQAANWLAEQGVEIISYSGGGHGGPHNGNSIKDRLVNGLVERYGLLWVNSAGNDGGKHWLGRTEDRDRNGLIDTGGQADLLEVEIGKNGFSLLLNWDDWGNDPDRPTAGQDIDMFLYGPGPDGKPVLVGRSENPQRGAGRPVEVISGQLPPGKYTLLLKASNLTRSQALHLYADGLVRLPGARAQGSIGIPATAAQALAVGAVDVRDGKLEAFSSQGPTDDGRVKPDVSAPDKTASLAYAGQGDRFSGTSAACPHVSGYAALIKSMTPSLDQPRLRKQVERYVRVMGSGSPNNLFGHGHIDANAMTIAGGSNSNREEPPEEAPPSPAGEQQVIESLQNLLRQGR